MKDPIVAYFSAEYAIADDMPIYAGGLGVLAADTVLEAAKQNRDFSAIGLVYHLAFTGDDPDQRPMTERLHANGFELAKDAGGEVLHAKVWVSKRTVVLQAWVKTWGRTRLILLDTNLSENTPEDRAICDRLYAADPMLQLAQEICLGFGGVAMLEKLSISPDVFHLNEGHTAMAGLAVVLREMKWYPGTNFAKAMEGVRSRLVGTKHTILPGAGILLDWPSVAHQIQPLLEISGASLDDLKAICTVENGDYSDTKLMIALTHLANGVSKLHVAAESHDHPHSALIPITNGVFRGRWLAENWGDKPLDLGDKEFWDKHSENRRKLFELIHDQTGFQLDPELLTVVWARRMAAYKRPELLVSDLKRLSALVHNEQRPVQFVVAGLANPADTAGVELMKRVMAAAKHPDLVSRFAYLPQYTPVTAHRLVAGADVWLNTPIRGYEACGTSGMKASLNGALQFSTSDGWVDEVDLAPVGWMLPDNEPAQAIYDLLEKDIAPLFYARGEDGVPGEWVKRMRANMNMVLERFTTERMLAEYYAKLYSPPAG